MPRKRAREKRLKNAGVPITSEAARSLERQRAEKNLNTAKALEAHRLANGYKWVTDGKTRRLVKVK